MSTTQQMINDLAAAAGSQSRIARLLNIDQMTISLYATGSKVPRYQKRVDAITEMWERRGELEQKRLQSDEFESKNREQLKQFWSKL